MENKWSFRKIVALEEALFNNTLEKFYNHGISGLVRENIQNSLDGKLSTCKEPVKVIIKTGNMKSKDIPGIEEIKEHILSLQGQNSYTRSTIKHMQASLNIIDVPYISFEDCNTKGLKGASHGELVQEGDTWGVYAYKKGVHHEESDEEAESLRGGSHGVGKIASNAASDLHLMYFANCDEYGNQHIGGTVELIEHELKGLKYRATGYFTKQKDDIYYPFENNFCSVFEKKTRGLKIIVPYLRKQFQGKENIIKAVCDNFFVAILKDKLEVQVDNVEINSNTIKDIVLDSSIYEEQEYEDIKTNFTPLYVKSFLEQKPIDLVVKDKKGTEYKFDLHFIFDDRIKKGRVAVVRGIGMKIEDKKVSGHANTSYNAVLIPKSADGDVFLKSLENESHTSLSWDHIKDPVVQNNAKRFINNIGKEIAKIISEYIEKENPSDGQIDTSELIYSVVRNFKKELSKQISSVEINKDRKNGKKVVKINPKPDPGKEKKKEKKEKKTPKPRVNKDTNKLTYPVKTESVKRLVVKNKEKLFFDFSEDPQYSGETECDISFRVIDGMGVIDEMVYDLNDNYSEIVDKKTGMKCKASGNTVKGIQIDNGKAYLEMNTTKRFNSSLKFMYYVEV